ncbi:MAG: hypothetical protein IPN17_37210 [Deltaproteobacteria bacterium]|nr:hypothetical protein [Deltaproteobacteria bacterium]
MTPSNAHESVLLWLRDDPSRLSTLLALTGHAPCSSTLAVEDSALRAAYPIEVTPDLVLRDPISGHWVLVEVQRQPDEAKARRWFLAMAAMAPQHGPHGELVVVTSSRAVARWALDVANHRRGGTSWGVTPTVLRLGPKEADALLTSGPPELAVIAAWVMNHRHGPGARPRAARVSTGREHRQTKQLRRENLVEHPDRAAPRIVEKVRRIAMIDINQVPKNPAVEQWAADLRQRRGARRPVLLLRLRASPRSRATEARILACMDAPQIERWADRALTATLIDEVFAEP